MIGAIILMIVVSIAAVIVMIESRQKVKEEKLKHKNTNNLLNSERKLNGKLIEKINNNGKIIKQLESKLQIAENHLKNYEEICDNKLAGDIVKVQYNGKEVHGSIKEVLYRVEGAGKKVYKESELE